MFGVVRKFAQRFTGAKPDDRIALKRQLAEFQERYTQLKARYDAAQTTDEFSRYWANADRYDADSANSKDVRHTLISRSRYERGNNGYAAGIANTYAVDLIGLGPQLRMQTGSQNFNRMVEREWYLWCKAVGLNRKLRCMAHAKFGDGEAIGVLRRNPRVKHRIPLDLVLYEAEQCQTPYLPFDREGYIDGIRFDEFGNPTTYDILRYHPGQTNGLRLDPVPEEVPADRVLHWFRLTRPGQQRAVPESTSTLNTGAAARRWREAALASAETAADFTLFLKTTMMPGEVDAVDPMSSLEIEKRMMTALPKGYEPFQMRAEHPNAQYEAFHKTLIGEQARPSAMPYNRAAADSSGHNFASGKLDFLPYFSALDVERDDCNELVLDKIFVVWFELAVVNFGWLGGDPRAISDAAREHMWDWPKHKAADEKSEATANETKLKSGQISLHRLMAAEGVDLTDEIPKMAEVYGITPEEMQRRLLDVHFPPPKQPAAPAGEMDEDAAVEAAIELLRARGITKINGVAHYG